MKKIICVLLSVLLVFSSCGVKYANDTYFALDTFIKTHLPDSDVDIQEYIKTLEGIISKTDSNSEVFKINENTSCEVSEETASLIRFANEVSYKTNGAFDITCGALSALWDFKSDNPIPPSEAEIEKAIEYVGYGNITVDGCKMTKTSENVKIDLGGIGKGYIAEKSVEYLHENGIKSGYLNLGGNIAIVGAKENGEGWGVAIRDPQRPDDTVGRVILSHGYLSVSGDYERCFEYNGLKYHHILDPKTGYPTVNELSSVAVISDNGTLADALSTALFVMGLQEGLQFYKEKSCVFEAIFITNDGYIHTTDGIRSDFELTSTNYKLK